MSEPAVFTSAQQDCADTLPDASRESMFAEPWPTTRRGWTDLGRDLDLGLRRLAEDSLYVLGVMERARAGCAIAQTLVGMAFLEGPDHLAAAAFRLGELDKPHDVRARMSHEEAFKWLRWASNKHFPIAQSKLGEAYYRGRGVTQDLDWAITWTRKAARAGYPCAFSLLKMELAELAQGVFGKGRPSIEPESLVEKRARLERARVLIDQQKKAINEERKKQANELRRAFNKEQCVQDRFDPNRGFWDNLLRSKDFEDSGGSQKEFWSTARLGRHFKPFRKICDGCLVCGTRWSRKRGGRLF